MTFGVPNYASYAFPRVPLLLWRGMIGTWLGIKTANSALH